MPLNQYLNIIKQNITDLTEIETIRYIYLYLASRTSFDLRVAFGSEKEKRKIYQSIGYNETTFNELLTTQSGICRSIAYTFEYILKYFGIKAITVSEQERRGYAHDYNLVTLSDKRVLSFDIQADLEYIQGHFQGKEFGIGRNPENTISKKELERIDKKIGYISDTNYYADEYYYLLKTITDTLPFEEKVAFLLANLDVYQDTKNMSYSEFKWYYMNNLALFLTPKEKRKIFDFDLYSDTTPREYRMCLVLLSNEEKVIYQYFPEDSKFKRISMQDFHNQKLKSTEKLPRSLKRM